MKLRNCGQALLEYLFVFALFSTIALGIVRGIGDYSQSMFKSFAYYLTKELTVGTCPPSGNCWHTGFRNGEQ